MSGTDYWFIYILGNGYGVSFDNLFLGSATAIVLLRRAAAQFFGSCLITFELILRLPSARLSLHFSIEPFHQYCLHLEPQRNTIICDTLTCT